MQAKDFLKQVNKLDKMIENKLIEKKQWMDVALNVTSGGKSIKINGTLHNMDKVQASKNPQKMADAINKYIDLEKEIDACVDKLIETKTEVVKTIEQLSPAEYDLLHKVYIQYMSFQEVALIHNRSYTSITTLHGRALASLQRILDERVGAE